MVALELIGCRFLKRQANGELLWGLIVETEAYSQAEPACHGHRRRALQNKTLFGEPGQFDVYVGPPERVQIDCPAEDSSCLWL